MTTATKTVIATSLQALKDAHACIERYTHLRRALGKDYGLGNDLPLTRILETNGREDVLWALENAVDGGDEILRLWAADCAEHVLPIFLKVLPNDTRPADAIKAARQFARGEIGAAAWAAAGAAAWAAARAAAWDAGDAAWAAAGAAAWAAAWAAARDAGDAARAAGDAAAAGAAEEQWQTARLIQYLNGEIL